MIFCGGSPQGGRARRRAGLAGFAPAGPARLADGLRFACRRAGGNAVGPAWPRTWAFRGLRAPGPRVLFPRRKSTQKGASPFWAGPRPLPNWTPAMEHCAATECLFYLRLPRNRRGSMPTSPVGPRDDRYFLSCKANRFIYLFKRATAEVGLETRLRSDPRRIHLFSGNAPSKHDKVRLDKRRGLGSPQRFFRLLLGVQKWARGPGARSPRKASVQKRSFCEGIAFLPRPAMGASALRGRASPGLSPPPRRRQKKRKGVGLWPCTPSATCTWG